MMKALCNAVLRFHFLLIVFFLLILLFTTKFFDSIQLRRTSFSNHKPDRRSGAFTKGLSPPPDDSALVGEFRMELNYVNGEIIGKVQTHSPCFQTSTSLSRKSPRMSCKLRLRAFICCLNSSLAVNTGGTMADWMRLLLSRRCRKGNPMKLVPKTKSCRGPIFFPRI